MTDWTKVAPKRAANAVKALGLLAKTAGRGYDVPAIEAAVMLGQVRDAYDALQKAYGVTPVVAEVSDAEKQRIAEAGPGPVVPKPRPVWRDPPHVLQIDRFVADVRPEHIGIYVKHFVHRLCERADDIRAE